MARSSPLDRRDFLRRALAFGMHAAAWLSIPWGAGACRDEGLPFGPSPRLRALGRHYLNARPDSPSSAELAAELPPELLDAWQTLGAAGVFSSAAFESASRADFAGGRIESLDGWWMSSSELRVCALIALTAQEGENR